MKQIFVVNGQQYETIKLLGHGKGGYSFLAKGPKGLVVVKKIHHEKCDYYQFGNKIEAESFDYQRLADLGIRMPKMIDIDYKQELIVKEYIDGSVVADLIKKQQDVSKYIPQVVFMAELAKAKNLNIDYYPTNFVIQNEILYYIDYECNNYSDEWNFENWGIKYWTGEKPLN